MVRVGTAALTTAFTSEIHSMLPLLNDTSINEMRSTVYGVGLQDEKYWTQYRTLRDATHQVKSSQVRREMEDLLGA